MADRSPSEIRAGWRLRPARDDDTDDIARLWHLGWGDGHRGHVPDALLPHRTAVHFRRLVPPRVATTTVAVDADGRLLGFVTVQGDEVEEMYVAAEARGSGVAAELLSHGEAQIARAHDEAWLAVVRGNVRARRFYERQGWADGGDLAYEADVVDGTLAVPTRRYVKRVR